MTIGMFSSFITRHWFSEVAIDIWSDEATLQAWLDVEAALALAQAKLVLIPPEPAERIAACCDAKGFDYERLSKEIAFAQHPFVPVLKQLEELCGEPAAGFIHWGATTQNIFDTAIALQLKKTHLHLIAVLERTEERLKGLAFEHRQTLQAGRTHGQHALPMTFGFKVAGWHEEIRRSRERLAARGKTSFLAYFGGAIGTFAAMDGKGRAVEDEAARLLGLQPARLPLRSSFDRVTDYLAALAVLAGSIHKIAQDIVFMQRSEIGEIEEAFHMGKVGSSTMAQKRNPSAALVLVSLCRMLEGRLPMVLAAMVRMDEGDSSATNIADIVVGEIAVLAASIAEGADRVLSGLHVNAEKMRRNLDLSRGLILSESAMMQLSPRIGRHKAHHLLYEAAQRTAMEGTAFSQTLADAMKDAGLADVELDLSPDDYLGEIGEIIEDLCTPRRG
ncbi:adenylosuccinate lyase [Sinorhizobium fredii NGR234]|uniref:Adenylosuccinate lyase n=1 Tax=Sinorhizobium fredii (strain NBRC 101917 / NGR234) TaxID=394 RepID=C3MHA8_SINFN|nr:adenylosuccinate lyase family protein [Sinorhizobium fredii]ACP26394.1 adenylosuccinate lyase [Sinorhizobium fredii NGR234]